MCGGRREIKRSLEKEKTYGYIAAEKTPCTGNF
jgi:hypothetical protein